MTEETFRSTIDRATALMRRCDELNAFTSSEGQLTRLYGTPALRGAIDQVARWMEAAGMIVSIDHVGNLVGIYEADTNVPQPRTFIIGGHLDSVKNAGRYDGPLGVLCGVAFIEGLAAGDKRLPFHVQVIAFADEEGVRFHTTYLGSRTLAGTLSPEALTLTDEDGVALAAAIREFGGDPDKLSENRRDPGDLLGFIEVHIEQGPILERRDVPVGVVSAIAGATRVSAGFTGIAGHAGTVPMDLRRDALPAAAEFVLAVERIASGEEGLVGTVGQLIVSPGASNVIAGHVESTLDLRHPDETLRATIARQIEMELHTIGNRRKIETQWTEVQGYATVECDLDLMSRLIDAIADEGFEPLQLASGAGHDAVALSEITPVSMLFVRCKGGVSHNPLESITVEDVEVAIRVLDRFMFGIVGSVASSFQLDE